MRVFYFDIVCLDFHFGVWIQTQWVALPTYSFRVPTLNLSLGHCLCGVSFHVLTVSVQFPSTIQKCQC